MKKIHIAIVEDDADDREFINDALGSNENLMISTFKNGTEFLNFIEIVEELPHLIITDLRMPLISGFEVIMTIKTNDKTKNIPIIVFSTSGNKEDIAKANKLGAAGYYVKPYSLEGYRKITNTILEGLNKGLLNFTTIFTNYIKPFLL